MVLVLSMTAALTVAACGVWLLWRPLHRPRHFEPRRSVAATMAHERLVRAETALTTTSVNLQDALGRVHYLQRDLEGIRIGMGSILNMELGEEEGHHDHPA